MSSLSQSNTCRDSTRRLPFLSFAPKSECFSVFSGEGGARDKFRGRVFVIRSCFESPGL